MVLEISGQRLCSNLVAVHSKEQLISYAAVFIGYGIWADAIHYSETRRHFEALRYTCTFLTHNTFLTLHFINVLNIITSSAILERIPPRRGICGMFYKQ